jgi:GTP-binding protein HflX
VLGKGKLEELARLSTPGVSILVDTDRLSKVQEESLAGAVRGGDAVVMDRTRVILNIFKMHAKTRAAKLQVEMAELTYNKPAGVRVVDSGGGGRGVGKGVGEAQTELGARQLRDRLANLRKELESIDKEAAIRRERRSDTPRVAIVGYTNAGKSSIMKALTGSDVLVEDKLFATLSTTSRVLRESTPKVLVSDTVGFIRKLPTELVASFAATLAEAVDADVLLHVLDASDPDRAVQFRVTEDILQKIGATKSERLLVLNKSDLLSSEEQRVSLMAEYPNAILVSSKSSDDMSRLTKRILQIFEKDMDEKQVLLS